MKVGGREEVAELPFVISSLFYFYLKKGNATASGDLP